MMPSKGDLTKQKILATARERFYLRGYHHTSIDDIIRASKVKRGNLYFHYESKEALGYAVIDSYLTDEVRHMDGILAGPGSPMERLYRLLESFKRQLTDRGCRGGCPVGNLAIEMSDLHDGFRKEINRIFDAWQSRLVTLMQEAKKEGEIPPSMDAKALANFMVALWEGGVLLMKTRKDPRVMGDCIKSLKGIVQIYRA